MKYEIIGRNKVDPTIAILCPRIQKGEIEKHYYDPYLASLGEDIMVCDLFIDGTKKKTSAAQIKEYLNDLLPNLIDAGIKMVVVTQPDYFKVLTKKSKTDATIGDVVSTVLGDELLATYCPNYSRIFYDPDKTKAKIKLAMDAVFRWADGDTSAVGANIIKYAAYPKTNEEILDWLDKLYEMDCDLTCDIEGFGLKHYDAGIGTITFCWSETEGIAFPVDYESLEEQDGNLVGKCVPNHEIRAALKTFFYAFKNKMIYHNICYDVYVLVYQLFMDHILDQDGLLEGLNVLLRNWDCSQLITYLATNSCAGNELGLKVQAQEYAGNYAQEDIKDIRLIPMDDLLEYNLVDGLSTWYVYKKNLPIAIADQQMGVYNDIFVPAVMDIIQMQLSGMPINMWKVKRLNKKLQDESNALEQRMLNMQTVQGFLDTLRDEYVVKKNSDYKKKVITVSDIPPGKVEFNPNSAPQLQRLLYSEDFLGLPVLDYTDSKLPATGADTLEKLLSHTNDPDVTSFLGILIEYKASAIILSTFLPAFLKAQEGNDGWHYLFGNFRLGGTASGRLSSNNPNLQNIPSSGSSKVKKRLAKLIKECFEAPPGWLFVGLDFDSLEDKISAVTTRDPEKIKVYSDGYDGHCLRALAYFGDQMPDIELCPEDAVAYEAIINGEPVYFHSEEQITYQGQPMTGQELFDKLNK